jgi:hypothetical protein
MLSGKICMIIIVIDPMPCFYNLNAALIATEMASQRF